MTGSDANSPQARPRPGSQPSAPSASHYVVELPYAEELQAMLEGRYVVESFLGQGGMGAVYKGLQMPLKRPVAIKILQKREAAGAEDEFAFEERFKREAYAMASLTHPSIVQVYDCGDAGEHFLFISMELLQGGDLSDVIKAGTIPADKALKLIAQICDGLQAAHERGIVHRDIKPANIFLTADGRAKVADFGLAKRFDAKNTLVTKTGLGMGTPDYAAPEQYEPELGIDHRADLYALGVMMYQMLTGRLPRGVYKMPSQIVPGLDPRLDGVVGRAMMSEREERWQSAAEIKAAIAAITAPQSKPAPASRTSAVPVVAARPAAASPARPSAPAPARPSAAAATARARTAPAPVKKASVGVIAGILGAVAAVVLGALFLTRKPSIPSKDASDGVLSSASEFTINGHHYRIVQAQVTWKQAKARAESMKGRLAVVNSKAEHDALMTQLSSRLSSSMQHVWIGLSHEPNASEWKWITGEIVSLQGWASAQPDTDKAYFAAGSYWFRDGTMRGWDDAPGENSPRDAFLVEWDDAASAPVAAAKSPARIFDGKTLDGWKVLGDASLVKVSDGAIHGSGRAAAVLYLGKGATPAIWKDFDLSFKTKTEAKGNSGVWVHCSPTTPMRPALALEVQIDNGADAQTTGSIFGVKALSKKIKKDGEWFNMRVLVKGMKVTVFVDGVEVNQWTQPPNWQPAGNVSNARLGEGVIGFQVNGGEVWVKDIEITAL